jgi:hypothetical protein
LARHCLIRSLTYQCDHQPRVLKRSTPTFFPLLRSNDAPNVLSWPDVTVGASPKSRGFSTPWMEPQFNPDYALMRLISVVRTALAIRNPVVFVAAYCWPSKCNCISCAR